MKKDLILEQSIKILAEKGYFNTTTRMLSEKAEIAVGTIYNHFKNKEDILDQIFQREYQKRAGYLEELQGVAGSQVEKLLSFIDFHFDELGKDEDLAVVLIRESTNPELQHLPGVQAFMQQLPGVFRNILAKAIEKDEVRALNTTLAAEIIFSTIRGTVYHSALKEGSPNLAEIKQELKDFITHAITKI